MFDVLWTRGKQGYRTMRYPQGPPPELPERFAGRPIVTPQKCTVDCGKCIESCPVGAIARDPETSGIQLDTGRCLFCRNCEQVCENNAIAFRQEFRMAAASREELIVRNDAERRPLPPVDSIRRLFGRSLKLRQVSAGGCGACEADTNVLGTIGWDLGRFGIQFVASPRHADGLLITGPVTENIQLALKKTYNAIPSPKIVIAAGACAIGGGPYVDHAEVHNGAASTVPVDLYIPGCPPHPLTILDALLEFLGRR